MKSHLPLLTGLRGLAALIVFIEHGANEGLLPVSLGGGLGQVGVMLFFVLSGFLMGHLYLHLDCSVANVKQFFFARAGRITPLYITLVLASYIIVTLIYSGFLYKIDSIEILIQALLFIQAPQTFWTIPVEVQFYAYFVIFWYAYKNYNNTFVLFALVPLSIFPTLLEVYLTGGFSDVFSAYSYAFFVGILFSELYANHPVSEDQQKWINRLGWVFLILLFLNLPEFRFQHGLVHTHLWFQRIWFDPVTWFIICGLFYCALNNASSLSVLQSRVFVYLGEISYGVYLLHYPVLYALNVTALPTPLKLASSLALAILLAHGFNKILEKPANQAIRAFGARRSVKATAAIKH